MWTPSPISAPGRSRANGPTIAPSPTTAPSRWLKARIADALAHAHAGAEHHVGLDHGAAADPGVRAEDRRSAASIRVTPAAMPGAQSVLEGRLGLGELGPGVDADRLLRGRLDRAAGEPALARDADDVGEVVLALGVVVADLVEQRAAHAGRRAR